MRKLTCHKWCVCSSFFVFKLFKVAEQGVLLVKTMLTKGGLQLDNQRKISNNQLIINKIYIKQCLELIVIEGELHISVVGNYFR